MIGVYKDNNLGDPLVFDCNKYMIEHATDQRIEIEYYDFMARNEIKPFITPDISTSSTNIDSSGASSSILGICKKIIGRDTITTVSQKIRWFKNRKKLDNYYKKAFESADMALIAGAGTIKWGSPCICSRYTGRIRLSQSRATAEAVQMLI